MAYDAENRMTSYTDPGMAIDDTDYDYDGDGRRVKKTNVQSGNRTIYVYDTFGSLAAEYFEGTPTATAGTFYRTLDHLGSTRIVTDAGGAEASRLDYTPFGELIPASLGSRTGSPGYDTDAGIRQKFTGQERDDESALDYFGARYLGSALGRFTSPDALFLDQDAIDPQSWNLYAYVRGNPLVYVDPSGRACTVLNSGSSFCQRATLYGELDAKVRGETRFFAAASATSQALANVDARIFSSLVASGTTQTFLSGLGETLRKENLSIVKSIQAGSLGGPGLDAEIVHMEQTAVQSALDQLRESDPAAFDQVIEDANALLNPSIGARVAAVGTDVAYIQNLDEVRKDLGRDIDFSKQSDREAIGNKVIKHIRNTGGCDVTGDKVPGC